MVICSLDALKNSSQKKETGIEKENVEVLTIERRQENEKLA